MKINVGFLLSYDYELLKISIPLIYDLSDQIILSYDKNFQTWAGNPFEISNDFFEWVQQFDTEHKITLLAGNYFQPELTTMQCETEQRQEMAEKLGKGFHLQIDSDEFAVNFKEFIAFIKSQKRFKNNKSKAQLTAYHLNIFKKLDHGYLLVDEINPFYLGTDYPDYERGRKNKKQIKIYSPGLFLHQTWGRPAEEVYFKMKNWGHNEDFDVEKYFDFWKSIDENNFQDFSYFHPYDKKVWKKLKYVPAQNLDELVIRVQNQSLPEEMSSHRWKKNLGQKFKFLFK